MFVLHTRLTFKKIHIYIYIHTHYTLNEMPGVCGQAKLGSQTVVLEPCFHQVSFQKI